MAPRRAKRRPASPSPARPAHAPKPDGVLAHALRAHLDAPPERNRPPVETASAPVPVEPPRPTPAPKGPTPPEVISPEEAMRRAFEADETGFWDGKFAGRGVALPAHVHIDDGAVPTATFDVPEALRLSPEEREFLDAMEGDVRARSDHPLRERVEALQQRLRRR
jgi:hypothetical protein